MSADDSFYNVCACLAQGDETGAEVVFHRFAGQLMVQAKQRLNPRLRQKIDPEDVVQSVFKSFFRRQADQPFDLENWESLWGLLLQITIRKCHRWVEHYGTHRRNLGAEVSTTPTDKSSMNFEAEGHEPRPSEIAVLNEMLDGLQQGLEPVEWEILSLRLQDYTVPEISVKVQRSERTVGRLLQRIRQHLAKQLAE